LADTVDTCCSVNVITMLIIAQPNSSLAKNAGIATVESVPDHTSEPVSSVDRSRINQLKQQQQ
jgi:hypothetical protein